jgi:hypothetical protein
MNLGELLKRATLGELTNAELLEVVRMVTSNEDLDSLYTLVQILGKAGSPKYRKIVEPYLNNVGDPQLSALAVQVLCWHWGLAGEYRDKLLRFLKGVEWDVDGYVRLQTISSVGEHLRVNSDVELLQMIFRIFSEDSERPLIRSAAYFSLCRSDGKEWRDIPPASRVVDFLTEIDQEVLKRVARKLGRHLH